MATGTATAAGARPGLRAEPERAGRGGPL